MDYNSDKHSYIQGIGTIKELEAGIHPTKNPIKKTNQYNVC